MIKEQVEQLLVSKGLKVTRSRKILLSVMLEQNERCFSAQELFIEANKVLPTLNFSTVYRNLEILLKHGLIVKLDSSGTGVFRIKEDTGHSHYLICKSCGNAKQLDYCPFKDIELKSLEGFLPLEHTFEVYGYCRKCQKEDKEA